MKSIIFIVFSLITTVSYCQLIDGTLVDEQRKLKTETNFKITDSNEGIIYYELAVNRKGMVTSAKLLREGTTVISTPTKILARNYAMSLLFEEGTHFPEFHHVRVKVTVAKE